MRFTRSALIPDVIVIEPEFREDDRGSFVVSYQRGLFERKGIADHFIQDNRSVSSRGVIRGLHFQRPPKAQAKLLSVLRGSVFDAVVDIRRGSCTYGRCVCETLSAENRKMIYVPAGFAHGFCALEDRTEFFYKTSVEYSPEEEGGILWNDPALAIPWPKLDVDFILSERDRRWPRLADARLP